VIQYCAHAVEAGEDISTISICISSTFVHAIYIIIIFDGWIISFSHAWSYTSEEELTAEKDESIYVFSVWRKVFGVVAIFLFSRPVCVGLFT